jgi:LPS export ABC transporter protein LptC
MRSAAERKSRLRRRVIGTAALLAGAVTLYHLLLGGGTEPIETTTPEQRRGYYLSDAVLTEVGVDGRPRMVVRADNIEQQVEDRSVILSHLELDYRTEATGTWKVTADRGRMPADQTSLQLEGNVTVRGGEPGGPVAIIRSEQLAYDTGASIIQTPDPVTVVFGKHELNGRGLRVDLNARTLRLESNVNGRFLP